MLGGDVERGDRVRVEVKDEELTFEVERGAAQELVEAGAESRV